MQPSNVIPPREIKDILYGDEARATVLAGVEKGYNTVASTYGASALNVLQGMIYGDPVLTRDGVTVAKRVVLPNRAEDDAWKVMRQASEKTNKTAGDGTTGTVVLGYHLLKAANKRVVAGDNPMKLKAQMVADSRKVIDWVNSQSVKADKHLVEVATVSAGDANIGALIADTLKDVGVTGGITIHEQSYPTIDVEKINGYYFAKGFFALSQEVEWKNVHVLASQKPLTTQQEIMPIIKYVNAHKSPQIVIIGEIRGDALQALVVNSSTATDANGNVIPFEGIVIPPAVYGDEGKHYMDDIAIYTGGKVLTPGVEFTPDMLGSAGSVKADQKQAIIFDGAGGTEAITSRASEIKQQVDKETDPHVKNSLESRYSKLVGKIAIVNVGASTPTEMEELRFRVEDAIEATKSAMQDGIVPGGGTMLARAGSFGPKGIVGLSDISQLYKDALIATFKKLYENAGEDASYRYKQVITSKHGYGFNLRNMTEEPVDLAKEGIWDATRAVVQIVENATSAAGALLTVGALVTPRDEA